MSYKDNLVIQNLFKIFIINVLVIGFTFTNSYSQPNPNIGYKEIKVLLQSESEFTSFLHLNLDLESATIKPNSSVRLIVNTHEIEQIKKLGLNFETLIEDYGTFVNSNIQRNNKLLQSNQIQFGTNFSFGSIGGYHKLAEIYQHFDNMVAKYPKIVSKQSIGKSSQGRDLYCYRFTTDSSKKLQKFVITALHHAREPIGATSLIYTFWNFLERYINKEQSIKQIFDNVDFYVIPVLNPDGYYLNETSYPSRMWRKNMRKLDSINYGVDLNRNYGPFQYWDFPIDGSSTKPIEETYRGTSPFSEPEIISLRDFSNKIQPNLVINFHSFGDILITPFGAVEPTTPDSSFFSSFGVTEYPDYKMVYGKDYLTVRYSVRGGSDDWFYGKFIDKDFRSLSLTAELGNSIDAFWNSSLDNIISLSQKGKNIIEDYSRTIQGSIKVKSYQVVNNSQNTLSLKINFESLSTSESSKQISHRFYGVDSENPVQIGFSNDVININTIAQKTINYSIVNRINLPNNYYKLNKFKIGIESKINNVIYYDTLVTNIGGFNETFLFKANSFPIDWYSEKWGLENDYISNSNVFTDSPYIPYSINEKNYAYYTKAIDLADSVTAELYFETRFNIEKDSDFGIIQYQIEGDTIYHDFHTSFMNIGFDETNPLQKKGSYGFHGHVNEWVYQKVDLNFLKGKKFNIRLGMLSDGSVNYNGIYFKNIVLRKYSDILLNINNETINSKIYNFINISNNKLHIDFSNSNIMNNQINIYNLLGELIYSNLGYFNDIDISALNNGLYTIIISNSNEIARVLFNKQEENGFLLHN